VAIAGVRERKKESVHSYWDISLYLYPYWRKERDREREREGERDRERKREREEPLSSWRPYRSPRTAEICTKRFAVSEFYPGALIRVGSLPLELRVVCHIEPRAYRAHAIVGRELGERVPGAGRKLILAFLPPPPAPLPTIPLLLDPPSEKSSPAPAGIHPRNSMRSEFGLAATYRIIWKFDVHCCVYIEGGAFSWDIRNKVEFTCDTTSFPIRNVCLWKAAVEFSFYSWHDSRAT